MTTAHSNTEFNFVDAVYRQESDPAYAGNPFVEALPSLYSLKELQRKLAYLPRVSPEERTASAEQRLVRLGELSQACIPLPRVVNLAQSIHKMLFDGYRNRRPFTPTDRVNTQRLYEAQQSGRLTATGNHHPASQLSMSLIGTPGSGKSFILKKIANLFPPLIYHPDLGRWQVPFLFIEMSYDGASVYTLASQIFLALDRLMPGSGYFRTYVDSKSINAERLCMKALNVAYELGVGMIVVDEAQNSRSIGNHIIDRKKPVRVASAKSAENGLKKLLITASNVGHMPLLFTGTMELQPTVAERASLARRKAGRGSATWEPLTRKAHDGSALSEFDVFMRVLFEMQWLPQPVTYDQAWSDLFFEYTQGIPDFMVKLFDSSQVSAIREDAQSLDPSHVVKAFGEFRSVEATLKGLENRDEASLLNLTDVFGLNPPELSQTSSPGHFVRPQTVQKKPQSVGLVERINEDFKNAKRTKSGQNTTQEGPVPMAIDGASLAGSDLRNSLPVAESPLSPHVN
jgi:AAA domain